MDSSTLSFRAKVRDESPRNMHKVENRAEKSSFTACEVSSGLADRASQKDMRRASIARGRLIPMTYDMSNGTRKAYPRGRKMQMTDAWKAAVNQWLADNGRDRAWLAAELEVAESTVKRMLEEQNTSGLVPAVCEITGLPLPVQEVREGEDELLDLFRHADHADKAQLLALARRMARK